MADAELAADTGTSARRSSSVKSRWNCSRAVARRMVIRSCGCLVRACGESSAASRARDAGRDRAASRPAPGSRRRQFGCSSMVPGRFGCSAQRQHILDRQQRQLAGGARRHARTAASDHRLGSSSGGGSRASAAPLSRNACQSRSRSRVRARRRSSASSRHQPELRAPVDVAPAPPAGDGRQIVRAGHRRRAAASSAAAGVKRSARRARTTARACPSTPASLQPVLEALRHACRDPRRARSRRCRCDFQRDQPQQVVAREAQIGAVRRRARRPAPPRAACSPMAWSMRTPPAWRSAARSISMKAAKPCCCSPRGENAVMPQSWPVAAQQVGRRADRQPDQHLLLAAPGMAAAAIGADREIGDQADRHAGRARRCLRRREAAIGAGIAAKAWKRDLAPRARARTRRPRGWRDRGSSAGQLAPVPAAACPRRTDARAAPRTAHGLQQLALPRRGTREIARAIPVLQRAPDRLAQPGEPRRARPPASPPDPAPRAPLLRARRRRIEPARIRVQHVEHRCGWTAHRG